MNLNKTMKYFPIPLLCLLVSSFLSGCDSMKKFDSWEMETKSREQYQHLAEYREKVPTIPSGLQYEEGIQLGLVPVSINNSEELPPALQTDNSFFWKSNVNADLPTILNRLSFQTGIQHYLFVGSDHQPISYIRGFATNLSVNNGETHSTIQPLLTEHGLDSSIKPDFKGSLSNVLDRISAHYDLEWVYEDGNINLHQFVLKSYSLELLPTTTSSQSTIGATTTNVNLDLLTEIQSSLKNLIHDDEELVTEAGTGTLLLSARPSTHVRVGKYIKQINSELGQQIAIDVSVLTLNQEESEGVGIAFTIAGEAASGNTFELVETGSMTGATTLANVGLLSGDFSVDSFLSLLNKRGKVVVETRTGATTSNNRMVPIQVIREIAFAKTVESVADENGINLTRITPGQLATGFEMTLLPRVLNNLEILLHYNIRISDLNDLKEFTSNDQTIQLPNVATTEFEQQAILGNGETLVLAGFERERLTSNHKKGSFFSNQAVTESQKIATVILIRPRLLKRKTR